jgi:tetratricopeptide (TPR) repeat protein
MEKMVQQQLEEANKLIFVKRYAEAERKLDEVLSEGGGQTELIVHLRRIELAAMLKKLDRMRMHYQKELKAGRDLAVNETCLALVEQHGDMVAAPESINAFQEILRAHGASAAAYYGIAYSMEQQGNHDRAIFNYEQALAADPGWYVAYFGLSQIYYQQGDDKRGDHFFYLFEQAAPYNVYGNFETHRKLCQEFLEAGRYHEAEAAISALSEWWLENKGHCPIEIQVYELLATARISEERGDRAQSENRRTRAAGLSMQALDDPRTDAGVLYFIAKVLEEFDDFPRAFKYYRRILKNEGGNPAMVQKIGSQFLSLGEYRLAKELFDEAYQSHPENSDIRFCLLVANLKLAGVNVEEYLIGRERLRQLVDGNGDKVELLSLLHSLLAKYPGDAEVQGHIADVYLKLGNVDRAARHYALMFELDGKSRATMLKYAAFVMQYRDPERAMEILNLIPEGSGMSADAQAEVFWLKATYYARKKDHAESQAYLRRVLALDPWNVSYLVQEIINLTHLSKVDEEQKKIDPILNLLGGQDEGRLDWAEFEQVTGRMEQAHAYELVYSRRKLRYLYANGSDDYLADLVRAACRHDAARGTYDFMKLLNTNFDSPHIYWALGTIFKELWQLETACMWFEQMLMYPSLQGQLKAKAYLEMADCLVWQGRNVTRALEYAKIAVDLAEKKDAHSFSILAHAYLRNGQVRQAQVYLDQTDETDPEARFLKGLVLYRNGARQKANEIWKPLLTTRADSLRFHTIKQEVLKFYFEGAPYLKAN